MKYSVKFHNVVQAFTAGPSAAKDLANGFQPHAVVRSTWVRLEFLAEGISCSGCSTLRRQHMSFRESLVTFELGIQAPPAIPASTVRNHGVDSLAESID
jgi:hypothetical protein